MFCHLRMGTRWGCHLLAILALALIQTMLAGPAYAQLSDEQIAALRTQGQEKGWTFKVSPNPATRIPLERLCGLVVPKDASYPAKNELTH